MQRGGGLQDVHHRRLPEVPQETWEMIIELVREAEERERAAFHRWHLANLMHAAVRFFRVSRHTLPDGLGNLMGPNGGVKRRTHRVEGVQERMGYYCKLSTQNDQALMAQYGRRRGGIEFEYLMVVFFRLRGYYGMNVAVHMMSRVLRALAEGIEGPDYVDGGPATNYIPKPGEDESDDDLDDPPDPGPRPRKPTHSVPRRRV